MSVKKKSVNKKQLKTEEDDSSPKIIDTKNFKETNGTDINDLTTDEIFRMADLHFNKKNYIFRHLYDSYNKFLEEDVKNFLENGEHVFTETMTSTTYYKYRFKYENVMIDEPTLNDGIEPMFPSDARHENFTYSVKLVADVTQYQDIIDIASDTKITKQVGDIERGKHVATIPLMVRSKWCSLNTNKGIDKNECDFDAGGYFIVNGNEKVVICQDRMVENKPLVFIKKDSGASSYVVQCSSRSYKPHGQTQIMSVKMKKDGIMMLRVPILNEVNVCTVFRALGLESDRDIIDFIAYDEHDTDMVDLIRLSLEDCKTDKGVKISTQEEAIDYLIPKLRILKKYTESDANTKMLQKQMHLKNLLQNNFLPHVEGDLTKKAHYLGYMLNRLLKVYLKRQPLDDRDSYINKRIDLPGDLMFEVFKQFYKKLLGECKKFFDVRNKSIETPINVISNIKPNMIEQGFKASLSTGNWIRRQGVAQMLQRLTYLITISFLRRVDAPGGDASSAKLTSPRHVHPSSVPMLCCFTGDTEILMANGNLKQIKDLIDGDSVVTYDRATLTKSTTEIKNWFVKDSDDLVKITFTDGRIIKCTSDHNLLLNDGFMNRMVEASKLKIGDNIVSVLNQKSCVQIQQIEQIEPEKVYDFETVSDTHTFVANGFVSSNCVQTPEHAKVGLTKHLTIISSITIMSRDQYALLKDFLAKKLINVSSVPHHKLRNHDMYKVFLNGDWVGMTENAIQLTNEMKLKKSEGYFDQKNVAIVEDHDESEIRIYCDSGRLYRPTIKVVDNVLQLKRHHINSISLNKADKLKKITDWEEFLMKNPRVIEYVDSETQPYLLIADKARVVEEMRQRMINSIDLVKTVKSRHVDNRYDEMFYLKYTNCEFHPALLLGEISTNVPFSCRNPGPRNIFFYAQSRQAMGIFATNYRDRLDISFILYYPQRPLVSTRSAKYTNSEHLPAGENCMVAIACYTGYNQEDSLIFSRSAIERGKFRAMYLKKYMLQIQKNQSTSQDDQFMKPDPNKVVGMKHGSYDKLNDRGFVPEETQLFSGDVIFGKVTPIEDPNNTGKTFKDSSESYKMFPPGVVDRLYIDIQNQDGYMTRKASIRSDRIPRIGDKYSCYDDQTEILTSDGWIFFKDLTKNHYVATLHNDTVVYQQPINVYEYDHDGDMYKIESNHIDALVTLNHMMYVRSKDAKAKYKVVKANTLMGKMVKYKKNANADHVVNPSVPLPSVLRKEGKFILPAFEDKPEKKLNLDAFVEFFGIWIAEGYETVGSVRFAANKPRVKEALSELCNTLGYEIGKSKDKKTDDDTHSWRVYDTQLANYFKQFSVGAVNKFLPEWAWHLNQEQCRLLIRGMVLGDGHQMVGTTTVRYDTSSVKLANDFQRLCLHAGWSTNICLKYEAGHVATIQNGDRKGNIITSTQNAWRMSINTSQNEPIVNKNKSDGKQQDSIVKYKGKVYCCEVAIKDLEHGVVYVRRNGIPYWSCNSRHGQKGTIGILLDGVDMPFNKYGVKPDIIVNPNAIPSRMTIGQLVECLVGKTAALQGMDADGTAFEEHDIESVKNKLKQLGYNENGYEYLYNGMTGEKMKVQIFFGPTFYQRLKHLVEDKIHSRSRGPKTSLTRQAPEGRSRDGGLRLGEMERDALLGHGVAKFLKEKMLDNSDDYYAYVCDKCGIFAQRFERKENKTYSTIDDVYCCQSCQNYTDISKVRIPYAFKLFVQELMSMCIVPRIRCKKTIYNS